MISTPYNFHKRHVNCIVFHIDKRHDITFSSNGLPMNCKPIGRPFDCPQGTEIPGNPAKFTGVVNKSLAYIVNGSSISSPKLNAVVGAVGPTTTS